MLSLIYNFSILSIKQEASVKELLDGRSIMDFLIEKRGGKDKIYNTEKISYALNFCHEEDTKCVLSVLFRVGPIPGNIVIEPCLETEQLVKFSGNREMINFHNPYVFNRKKNRGNYCLQIEDDEIKVDGLRYKEIKIYTDYNCFCENSEDNSDTQHICNWNCKCWNKTKSITSFRKELGISGAEIETTKFKFKVVFKVSEKDSNKDKKIVVKTKWFSLHKKEHNKFVPVE
ncbi:hypothetical protein CDIK_1084 [Cucumispora dikerogammari]|nr:hypothetical protein CDIK_1084 [Cucumispora dikerogammari]